MSTLLESVNPMQCMGPRAGKDGPTTANRVSVPHNPEFNCDYSNPEGTPFFGILPDYEQTIRYAPAGPWSKDVCPTMTIGELFKAACNRDFSEKDLALGVERPCPQPEKKGSAPSLPAEEWKTWTWKTYNVFSIESIHLCY